MRYKNSFRAFVHGCLHDPADSRAHVINGLLSFLVVFSVAVVPLHFVPYLAWVHDRLYIFDQIVVTIFTIEYLLRLWSASRPLSFAKSWPGIVDLLAILPFYLQQFIAAENGFFEIFLVLRLLRLLKFATMYGFEQQALDRCKASRHGKFYPLPNEEVEKIVQKHPLLFLLGLVLPVVFTSIGMGVLLFFKMAPAAIAVALLFFVLAGVFFLKAWIDYNYDVIYITNFRVIVQNYELFGSETNGLMYDSITNVMPNNRGLIRWAIGLGHIEIESANRDATIIFDGVQRPHRVVRRISENRARWRNMHGSDSRQSFYPPSSQSEE